MSLLLHKIILYSDYTQILLMYPLELKILIFVLIFLFLKFMWISLKYFFSRWILLHWLPVLSAQLKMHWPKQMKLMNLLLIVHQS